MVDVSKYSNLGNGEFNTSETVAPEDEFFHSIYIAGVDRENESGEEEEAGKIQIRGVKYNLKKVHGIITHVKRLRYKEKDENGNKTFDCFCYQPQDSPWISTSGKMCPKNRAQRLVDDFCADCKENIISTFILCDEDGNIIKDSEENKPIFGFIRGKGIKYSALMNYLNERVRDEEIEFLLDEQHRSFEKSHINNKRYVTIIGMKNIETKFGIKKVFSYEKGKALNSEIIFEILDIENDTIKEFEKKFNWALKVDSNKVTTNKPDISKYNNLKPEAEKPSTKPNKNSKKDDFQFDDDDIKW